ncbi:uncharacterized protein Z518_03894 [Rhinocladiella mackenziei CBS 650.93]|uniref:N-acetyltransferase domain-containing protein n=1 Tax=Rhinocladiella mackenziei CBS 650.93 TaxID=1442369 RepID=A0A0D2J9X4_9EURO|nr:uncharacterized protein Z518_03894 [Rhinocladiella mackenziei CBS 650.93]KIX05920.1 hypothetical protein Z518_03894 [Rhinocladiella mackenziei CBS 650.93]
MSWKRDSFEISMDPSLIPLDTLNSFFSSTEMYWASPLPVEELQNLIKRSACFGLYEMSDSRRQCHENENDQYHNISHSGTHKLIGFARWITDTVTVNYLTDVYLLPSYRGQGLGIWMMRCIDEMFKSMPYVRGMIMIADKGSVSEGLYRRHLAMDDLERPAILLDRKGVGAAH